MALTTLTEVRDRLLSLADQAGPALVIGVAGAPGVGKTTLVEALMHSLNPEYQPPESCRFAHVPMDGFHLSDRELRRQGLLGRKGAPETFDAGGYAALLGRLRVSPRPAVVYAPGFDRTLEQPVAGDIPVFPAARVILTEGNYLLLDRPEWRQVRSRCDEVWYIDDDEQRHSRLLERHIRFGKSPDAAAAWVRDVDQPNAELVRASRSRADLTIRLEAPPSPAGRGV